MNTITLEQVYYIGELVAVIAVIASLLYVGKQIKQNAEAMQVNAVNTVAQRVTYYTSRLLENREAAECWVKAGTDFDNLDEVDKQRLILFEAGAIGNWHYTFQLRQRGLIPESLWQQELFAIGYYGIRQDVRAAWQFAKGGFDRAFQELMSPYLE